VSFLDEAFEVIKGGVNAVGNTVDNVIPDIKKFLQRFEELGYPSKGPSLLDKAGFLVDNPLEKLAGSPVLAAAQGVIHGMKLTTGWGEPEKGEQFETSAKEMRDAGMILVYADPIPDEWNGSASEAYAGTNSEHRHQTFEVCYADKEMQSILSEEATQIADARNTLTGYADFLADFDTATSWMSAIPGGAAAKAALDASVAATNVAAGQATMGKLMWDVSDNASKIQAAIRSYQGAADEEMLDYGSCTPFGEEHRNGKVPPSRTQSDQ
jgi:EspA/EspE family